MRIGRFYRDDAEAIERHRSRPSTSTVGWPQTGSTPAPRLIDMIFFIEGAPAVHRPASMGPL